MRDLVAARRRRQREVDRTTAGDETIEARWVVGADGADSTVRRLVGLDVQVLGDEGAHLSTLFRADLARHLTGDRYALHMVVGGEEFRVFVPSGTDGRWMFDRELHPERGDDRRRLDRGPHGRRPSGRPPACPTSTSR